MTGGETETVICPARGPNCRFAVRVLVEVVLATHLVVAVFFWWLAPQGFPLHHDRFWLNTVLPWLAVVLLCFALFESFRQRYAMPALCLAGCAAAWMVAAGAGHFLFPVRLHALWLVGVFPALLTAICCLLVSRHTSLPKYAWFLTMLTGLGVGLFAVWAQVPPTPSTHPLGELASREMGVGAHAGTSPIVRLSDHHRFHGSVAELSVDCGSVTVRCSPLLTFDRVSPDGFWSIFAPLPKRTRSLEHYAVSSIDHEFHYSDGSAINIAEPTNTTRIQLAAHTVIDRDTYSHLNSFCVLEITGHKNLSLAFSPCATSSIDVLPADYPTGRPARFAYLDPGGRFHVVEATSGEKGPFKQLASGPLRRGEPLAIFIKDDGTLVATVRLDDWTAQLSTALSPTAGWGMPVNAIEFQLVGTSSDSAAQVWITLAATSVGRGWDCVGHTAGSYRNRVVIDVETP